MNTFLISNTLTYLATAKHKRGHGIHSPFVYDVIRNVFIDKTKYIEFSLIEAERNKLLKNSEKIEVLDLGAGSQRNNLQKKRKIKSIAASSLSPKKYAQLLFKIARYYRASTILEMGTSLGISGSYLALANTKAKVISLEGAPEIAEQAQKTFDSCIVTNAEIMVGNFKDTLPQALQKLSKIDIAYIDGNHQKQATLEYFEQILPYCHNDSILIFDDIYWSKGMFEAWQQISKDSRVSVSIDICKLGFVFFRAGMTKQNFTIKY